MDKLTDSNPNADNSSLDSATTQQPSSSSPAAAAGDLFRFATAEDIVYDEVRKAMEAERHLREAEEESASKNKKKAQIASPERQQREDNTTPNISLIRPQSALGEADEKEDGQNSNKKHTSSSSHPLPLNIASQEAQRLLLQRLVRAEDAIVKQTRLVLIAKAKAKEEAGPTRTNDNTKKKQSDHDAEVALEDALVIAIEEAAAIFHKFLTMGDRKTAWYVLGRVERLIALFDGKRREGGGENTAQSSLVKKWSTPYQIQTPKTTLFDRSRQEHNAATAAAAETTLMGAQTPQSADGGCGGEDANESRTPPSSSSSVPPLLVPLSRVTIATCKAVLEDLFRRYEFVQQKKSNSGGSSDVVSGANLTRGDSDGIIAHEILSQRVARGEIALEKAIVSTTDPYLRQRIIDSGDHSYVGAVSDALAAVMKKRPLSASAVPSSSSSSSSRTASGAKNIFADKISPSQQAKLDSERSRLRLNPQPPAPSVASSSLGPAASSASTHLQNRRPFRPSSANAPIGHYAQPLKRFEDKSHSTTALTNNEDKEGGDDGTTADNNTAASGDTNQLSTTRAATSNFMIPAASPRPLSANRDNNLLSSRDTTTSHRSFDRESAYYGKAMFGPSKHRSGSLANSTAATTNASASHGGIVSSSSNNLVRRPMSAATLAAVAAPTASTAAKARPQSSSSARGKKPSSSSVGASSTSSRAHHHDQNDKNNGHKQQPLAPRPPTAGGGGVTASRPSTAAARVNPLPRAPSVMEGGDVAAGGDAEEGGGGGAVIMAPRPPPLGEKSVKRDAKKKGKGVEYDEDDSYVKDYDDDDDNHDHENGGRDGSNSAWDDEALDAAFGGKAAQNNPKASSSHTSYSSPRPPSAAAAGRTLSGAVGITTASSATTQLTTTTVESGGRDASLVMQRPSSSSVRRCWKGPALVEVFAPIDSTAAPDEGEKSLLLFLGLAEGDEGGVGGEAVAVRPSSTEGAAETPDTQTEQDRNGETLAREKHVEHDVSEKDEPPSIDTKKNGMKKGDADLMADILQRVQGASKGLGHEAIDATCSHALLNPNNYFHPSQQKLREEEEANRKLHPIFSKTPLSPFARQQQILANTARRFLARIRVQKKKAALSKAWDMRAFQEDRTYFNQPMPNDTADDLLAIAYFEKQSLMHTEKIAMLNAHFALKRKMAILMGLEDEEEEEETDKTTNGTIERDYEIRPPPPSQTTSTNPTSNSTAEENNYELSETDAAISAEQRRAWHAAMSKYEMEKLQQNRGVLKLGLGVVPPLPSLRAENGVYTPPPEGKGADNKAREIHWREEAKAAGDEAEKPAAEESPSVPSVAEAEACVQQQQQAPPPRPRPYPTDTIPPSAIFATAAKGNTRGLATASDPSVEPASSSGGEGRGNTLKKHTAAASPKSTYRPVRYTRQTAPYLGADPFGFGLGEAGDNGDATVGNSNDKSEKAIDEEIRAAREAFYDLKRVLRKEL